MFECKHATISASKSQLSSRDLTPFFDFSTRSGIRLANEYDLVAHGWQIKLAISCTEVHRCESTDGNSGTHEKVASPTVTVFFPFPFVAFPIPAGFPWESMHISTSHCRRFCALPIIYLFSDSVWSRSVSEILWLIVTQWYTTLKV